MGGYRRMMKKEVVLYYLVENIVEFLHQYMHC